MIIALDTNVLVRYVINDAPDQACKAMDLLRSAESILITHTVLLELEWVLRAVYKLPQQSIHKAITQILGLANVYVENADQLTKALSWYQNGMNFDDALHRSLATGADWLVTFNERFMKAATAQRLPVQLLK